MIALKPQAFQRCFQAWIGQVAPTDPSTAKRLVAIDGKTCRGSHDAANHLGPLHIVSAWASEEGVALGQVATEEKSNEITAIPQLLEQIDLKNTLITIDAMGCQKDIVQHRRRQSTTASSPSKTTNLSFKAAVESFFDGTDRTRL